MFRAARAARVTYIGGVCRGGKCGLRQLVTADTPWCKHSVFVPDGRWLIKPARGLRQLVTADTPWCKHSVFAPGPCGLRQLVTADTPWCKHGVFAPGPGVGRFGAPS